MKSNKLTTQKLEVFFDGQCIICSKEIQLYQKKDTQNQITFTDISSPLFQAEKEGLDPKKVKSVFHVKDSNKNLLTGIDGFIAIWDLLEIFRPLSRLAKSPLTRPIFDLGYFAFTKIRPILPKNNCADGSCHL